MGNSFNIVLNVKLEDGKDFDKVVNEMTNSVSKLNAAVSRLGKTLDKLGGGSGGLSKLKGLAKDLGEIITVLNKQESLGRGNLENITRTATTLSKFVKLANELELAIAGGGFKNIKGFEEIMSSIGRAFSALDKIKKPVNLVAVNSSIQAVVSTVKLLQEGGITSAGNMFTRWLKTTFQLKPLIGGIVSAMQAFAKLPDMKNAVQIEKVIKGLIRVLRLLKTLDFNPVTIISRWLKLRQLGGIAKTIVNIMSKFSKIKNVEGVKAASSAIRSITGLLTVLSKVSSEGQKLARSALRGGWWTQAGTIIAGLGMFMKKIGKALKSLSKFNKGQVKSLLAAAEVIKAFVRLIKLVQTEAKVTMDKKGGVGAEFGDKQFDLSGLRKTVDEVIEIAQYISKAKFDANKVLAFGELMTNLRNIGGGGGIGGVGGGVGGIFSGLVGAASNATQQLFRIFKGAASTIASIFMKLFAKNPFRGLLKSAQQTLSQISRSMRRFGREMSQLGMQMLASGGIMGFIQGKQVGMAMDFEAIMKQVEVLGGIVGEELENANTLILQLGESSVFSATEVASSVLELSKAGLSFEQIQVALEDILNLAAAGGIAIDDAATLVIQAVGSFEDLSFGDATMIVDTFVAAANIGTATVADLAAAFGYVGNTANTFGQEIKIVTAALTLMMDRGIEGSRAGRSLDAFMRSLIDPSAEAQSAIALITGELIDLGLVASDATLQADSQGNFRDLNEILGLISITTKDFSEAHRASVLSQISGSANAGRALLSLLGMYEDGTLVLDDYIVKQEESASAAEVGAALMDTTRGAIEEMSGAFETLLIKALTPVLKYGIRPLIDGITWIIRQISKLPEPVLAALAALVGLSTIFITLTGVFFLLSGMILQLMGFALVPLIGLLWSLANPLTFILALTAGQGLFMAVAVGAIALLPVLLALGGAFVVIRDALREGVMSGTLENLGENFKRLRDSLSGALGALGRFIGLLFSLAEPQSGGQATGAIMFIVSQISAITIVATEAVASVEKLLNILSDFITGDYDFGGSIVSALGNVGDILPDPGDFTKRFREAEAASMESFLSAFNPEGISKEILRDFDFDVVAFDVGKAFLAQNSFEYSLDVKAYQEWYEINKAVAAEVDRFRFLNERQKKAVDGTTVAVESLLDPLESLDNLLDRIDPDSIQFKILAENLEQFADNPIIKAIFGKDVTGDKLAMVFAGAVITIVRLRTELESLADIFTTFFSEVRAGEGFEKAFSNLLGNFADSAARIAAILLDTITTVFGIQGFESIIESLAGGRTREGFSKLGEKIIDYLVVGIARKAGFMAGILATIFDSIFGTSITDPVKRIFKALEHSLASVWSIIKNIFGLFGHGGEGAGGGESVLTKFINNLFGGAADAFEQVAVIIELIDDLISLGDRWISGFTLFAQDKGLFKLLLGDNPFRMATTLQDIGGGMSRLTDGVTKFFSTIKSFVSGNLSFVDMLKGMFAGLEDVVGGLGDALGSLLHNVFGPVGQNILDAAAEIDWAEVWRAVKLSAETALTAMGKFITWSWVNILKFESTEDISDALDDPKTLHIGWAEVWRAVKLSAETALTAMGKFITWSWANILKFESTIDWTVMWEAVKTSFTTFLDTAGTPIAVEIDKLFEIDEGSTETFFNTFIGVVETAGTRIGKILEGPAWDLAAAIFDNIKDSIQAIKDSDGDGAKAALLAYAIGLTAVSIATGLISIVPLIAFAGSLVIFAAGLMLLNGVLAAFPDVVEMLDHFASAEWSEGFSSASGALGELAGGILEVGKSIVDSAALAAGAEEKPSERIFGDDMQTSAALAVLFIKNKFKHMISDIGDFFDDLWERVRHGWLDKVEAPIITGKFIEILDAAGADIDVKGARESLAAELIAADVSEELRESLSDIDPTIGDGLVETLFDNIRAQLPLGALTLDEAGKETGGIIVNAVERGIRSQDLRTIGDALARDMMGGFTDLSEQDKEMFTDLFSMEGVREQLAEQLELLSAADSTLAGIAKVGIVTSLGSLTVELDEDGKRAVTESLWDLLNDIFADTTVTPGEAVKIEGLIVSLEEDTVDLAQYGVNEEQLSADLTALLAGVRPEIIPMVRPPTDAELIFGPEIAPTGPEEKIQGEDLVDMESVLAVLKTPITTEGGFGSFFGTAKNLIQEMTGKPVYGPIVGPDVFNMTDLQLTANGANTAIGTFSNVAVTDITKVRTATQGLTADLAAIVAAGFTITVTPVSDPEGGCSIPGRALGGPVMGGSLYEVIEDGVSELLQIGSQTYLIPGGDGTVVPPSPTLTSNANMPMASAGAGSGPVTINEGDTIVEVNGSGLSADELHSVMSNVMADNNSERARSIRRRLRASGR